ncbi:uncharacterized protein LOC134948663 [Pseudophryne corroboree]|uniref:uncharacterized protein LOC134948663 n=1 Tax=Pseudophryne corroboree TaxID=495146 RepID=UPI0030815256
MKSLILWLLLGVIPMVCAISPGDWFTERECHNDGTVNKGEPDSCCWNFDDQRWNYYNLTVQPSVCFYFYKKGGVLNYKTPKNMSEKAVKRWRACKALKIIINEGKMYKKRIGAEIHLFLLPSNRTTFTLSRGTRMKMKCCEEPFTNPIRNKGVVQAISRCINGSKELPFNAELSAQDYSSTVIVCTNTSSFPGNATGHRSKFYILQNKPEIRNETLIKIPATCQKVGIKQFRILHQFNISFPKGPKCNRIKREWYDILLGGAGTTMGALNSIDIETLTNKMSDAGSDMEGVVHMQAKWMPTVFNPILKVINWDHSFLTLVNSSFMNTLKLTKNISSMFKWTECSIRTVYQEQQKNLAQTQLMTGNIQVYRKMFNIASELWVRLYGHEVYCTDRWCWGQIETYNITKPKIMCKYFILAVLFTTKAGNSDLWTPQFRGQYIDPNNKTHDLSLCTSTDNGLACPHTTYIPESCQLKNPTSVCNWELHDPKDDIFIEVAPQIVCMITYDKQISQLYQLPNPFSGCLFNVTHLIWKNQTIVFYKDQTDYLDQAFKPLTLSPHNITVSIQDIINIINNTEKLEEHLRKVNYSTRHAQMQTIVEAGELKHMATQLKNNLQHHWWDIFTGKSPSVTGLMKTVLHPLLAIVIILIGLVAWNCYFSCKFRKHVNKMDAIRNAQEILL